jgi:uncharacterized protein (TIGR02302 family)
MTPLFNWIASRLGLKADRSERYVAAARLAILWERVWPALWPASGIFGLFVAAALFDVFASLPSWLHSLLLLSMFLGAGALLHRNLNGFRFPDWEDGARRVERDSVLMHRPISEGRDSLAAGNRDPWTQAVWRAHLRRLLARIADLRIGWPSPGLPSRDPYALRFAVLLLIVAGFVVAGSDWNRRLALAFTPDTGAGMSRATLDAWINPPAYTGEAPLYLQRAIATAPIAVPTGSELVLRVHDAATPPRLALDPEPDGAAPAFTGGSGEYGAGSRLDRNGDVRIFADGRLLGRWRIIAIPDAPPVIAFSRPPSKTERDALKIAFTAADDYGVTAARAIVRPVAAHSHTVLSVDLPLAAPSAKTLTQTVYRDLTDQPLAGVDVEIVLEAKDGAGQTGRSKPVRMRLPARVFANPLARALIEQRQTLAIAAPHAREQAVRTLDALTIAPDRFYADNPNVYIAIRAAYWGILTAHDASDIASVQQLLWDTAVGLEQGGLLSAAEQLRQLQQLLTQALAQGAPQDVIDALLDRYRQALQRYLQALAQNAPQGNTAASPDAKTMSDQDLDAMLKAIQQMSQTGARSAAAEALAMLQNLLENLHVTAGSGLSGGVGDKALSGAIQGLGDLLGRQRQLLDKSFRQSQGAGDPTDGGGRGLAQSQGKLRDDLDKIMKGLHDDRSPAPHSLGDAGRAMGEAQSQLGSNAFDSAGQAQKNAIEALRNGASELAKSLMKQSGQGQDGRDDPLGRQQGPSGAGGSGVKIPDRDALQRARSILEELRRRAAERGRPKEELDYYDRLLKEF